MKLSFFKKHKFFFFVHIKSIWTLKILSFSPARGVQLKWNPSSMNKKIPTVACRLLWRTFPTLCSDSRKRKNFIQPIFQHLFETYWRWIYITQTCKTKCFHTNSKTSLTLRKNKRPTQISFKKISSNAKRSYINVNPKYDIGKGQSKKNPHHLHKSTITCTNQEKGGFGGRWKARPKVNLHGLISPAQNSKYLIQNSFIIDLTYLILNWFF